MTAKTLVKTEVVDCTRGVSREQRAIDRGKKRDSPLSSVRGHRKHSSAVPKRDRVNFDDEKHKALEAYYEQRHAEWAKRYGGVPDKVATDFTFEEKPFGCELKTSANDTKKAQVLSRIVVSLALFDGDKMLFACSGIPIPDSRNPSTLCLTSFVTSARLAREFNANRYKNDKLRVEVRLPHGKAVIGFLGLYDEDIAIVTCIRSLDVHPVDLDCDVALDLQARQVCDDDDRVKAIGCLFKSGTLMTTGGCLVRERPYTWVSETQDLSEAVLGGPLIVVGNEVRFLGMNNEYYGDANVTFLSKKFLRDRLEHFQILNRKELHFRGYSLPKDVYRIEPSGFVDKFNLLRSRSYPLPPPLVMEFNGRLLNMFEENFGSLLSWKGYPFNPPTMGLVWEQLPKKVVTDLSHRVVSVASFNGDERFFACTGLLNKWHGKRAVVLTSASLVRSSSNDDIDNNLSIKVFVPPNHFSGTLEWYNLSYNIAIVSLPKGFRAIRREDILNKGRRSSGKVVAIGRDPVHGLLMASFGKVEYKNVDVKLDCKDLRLSTCEIKKSGIGGPLITLSGTFLGMNFYDGRKVTPFLPQRMIREVLWTVNGRLPSERGESGQAIAFRGEKNKWPVPEPYWYHGQLDVARNYVPNLPGRHLD